MTTLKDTSTQSRDIEYSIIKTNAAIERRAAMRDLINRMFRSAA
ncbi:MAG: hypothetical protein AAGG69_12500 [Pseudomonadota bacterium]